jgi:hypothetical protein
VPTAATPVVPPPPAAPPKPANSWDEDPKDLELEELARSIDLQFEDPSKHESESKADLHLEKPDDEK